MRSRDSTDRKSLTLRVEVSTLTEGVEGPTRKEKENAQ